MKEYNEWEVKIKQLKQATSKVVHDINNFDHIGQSSEDLDRLYKRLEQVKEDLSDLEDEIQVEDFLLYGPGNKTNK